MLPFFTPALWRTARSKMSCRLLHSTCPRSDITKFQMPAMSPTMTEGGIADWKKKDGESFSAGDVLLEIETDKATIDVEAQDDGIMGRIIAQNGTKNVPVGTTIALLAQEGDDISNLEVPPEEPRADPSLSSSSTSSSSVPKPSPSPPPSPQPSESPNVTIDHDRPLFPSVLRLLEENSVSDIRHIKGTGIRGMLTKGDVLAYLGKASSPNGTFKDNTPTPSIFKSQAIITGTGPPPKKALDPAGIRRAILTAFLDDSAKNRKAAPSSIRHTVDSVIADYLPTPSLRTHIAPQVLPPSEPVKRGYLDGLY